LSNHGRSAGTRLTGTSVVGACTWRSVVHPPFAAACASVASIADRHSSGGSRGPLLANTAPRFSTAARVQSTERSAWSHACMISTGGVYASKSGPVYGSPSGAAASPW
jgi:hypothetical protein